MYSGADCIDLIYNLSPLSYSSRRQDAYEACIAVERGCAALPGFCCFFLRVFLTLTYFGTSDSC